LINTVEHYLSGLISMALRAFAGQVLDTFRGLAGDTQQARTSAAAQPVWLQNQKDWRVRLSLAPGTNFLYSGIMSPLAATGGVIFPYTPNISIAYAANYEAADPIHSNYKIQQYKNSAVDSINITCDFTAQDTAEADYLLAVIHFFRTTTKMFYGQQPAGGIKTGMPPPLCFLHGLGAFQFDNHPIVITNFTYTLPTEVDYIKAGVTPVYAADPTSPGNADESNNTESPEKKGFLQQTLGVVQTFVRLAGKVQPGGLPSPPRFSPPLAVSGDDVTYVPTKIQIQIQAVPIVSRNDISNNFNLGEYATGNLLRGSRRNGGGIW
jgi:hypothetical protein